MNRPARVVLMTVLIGGIVLLPEATFAKPPHGVRQKPMQGTAVKFKHLDQLANAKREKEKLEQELEESQKKYKAIEGEKESESAQLKQLRGELEKRQKEVSVKQNEIERLDKETERLNQELQEFKKVKRQLDLLKEELSKEKKAGEKQAKELEKNENEAAHLKKAVLDLQKKQISVETENDHLRQLTVSLQEVQKNGAQLYEELGTLYTRAKLFDRAIEAYQRSLTYQSANPIVHYNLGLLYEHFHNDSKKAGEHLREYLRLKPMAGNRQEVQYLISMLGNGEKTK